MDFGNLLSRSWDILWNNKYLVLLGILISLGGSYSSSSGGGGSNSGYRSNYNEYSTTYGGDIEDVDFEELFSFIVDDFQRNLGLTDEMLDMIISIGIALCLFLIVISIVFWIVGNVARGGLIAAVSEIETSGASSFGAGWRAAWEKAGNLIGIGFLASLPGWIMLGLIVVMGYVFYSILFSSVSEEVILNTIAGYGAIMMGLCCVILPISFVLALLRALANRACMLENLGVVEAYGRAWEIVTQKTGDVALLTLIQIGIQIAWSVAMIVPSIFITFCPPLWPLLWVVGGITCAFYSIMWTLAWRNWTGSIEEGSSPLLDQAPKLG